LLDKLNCFALPSM